MFIGRERELAFFEEKYRSPGAQLVVLYGRRRIGKTELLNRFCRDKPHVFYSCRELSDAKQLNAFSAHILKAGSPAAKYTDSFQDWESAFNSFTELPMGGKKKLLLIDEFPYMCRGNPSIPSLLQILWDESLKEQDLMIVLCGSAMSFIEDKILSEKSPLYGRATGIYHMRELPFDDAIRFLPSYSPEDKMLAYAVLGGIPHYLQQFDPAISLKANIVKNVLTKGCALYSEVEFLIRQELREAALYNTIIETVALGNTQLNDIYTKTQIDKSKISVYLKNLIELQIIEREFSVLSGTKEQATSTRGLYRITDHFFRFWYRFVFTNLSDLETGDAEGVYSYIIEPGINEFASGVFEAICRDFIRRQNQLGKLPFRVSKSGRWWGKLNKPVAGENGKMKRETAATEIDVVAVDERMINTILGECKYRNEVMRPADLEKLKDKSAFLQKDTNIRYALFSKAGFSKELVKQAENDRNLMLFSLADIVNDTWR